jgi:arsenate reductase-like glutaredoxin family protein
MKSLRNWLIFVKAEDERHYVKKTNIINRLSDQNVRLQGQAFRLLKVNCEISRNHEQTLLFKQRGILKKILDVNVRLMGMGFNKLLQDSKHRQSKLKAKLQFLLKTLTDQDAAKVLQAYNALKRRKMMLDGVGLSDQDAKKAQFLKRLTNKPFDLQCQAYSKFIEFLRSDRKREQDEKDQWARDQKERDRILRRIMNKGIREMGQAYTQAFDWTLADRKNEQNLMFKQRGILRKMSDVSTRLMSMGFNKLIQEWKAQQVHLKDRLKFVLRTLTDQDASAIYKCYNMLRENQQMINGIGTGLKMQFVKKILDKGFDLMCQTMKQLQHYNKMAKADDERLYTMRANVVKLLSDSNARLQAQGYRKLRVWCQEQKTIEETLMFKQRGIMRKILDTNVRLMGMGFNRLVESHRANQRMLREKLKFVMKTLGNQDLAAQLTAYNQLKTRKRMLDGVGLSNSYVKKIQLLKRLTNKPFDLQCQAFNQFLNFLKLDRIREEAEVRQAQADA